MILDSHVHLPSPGLNQTWEWAPCTPDLPAALAYLKRCGVDAAVASSMRAEIATTHADIRAGNDEMMDAAREFPLSGSSLCGVLPACLVNTNFAAESLAEIERCHAQGVIWLGELCGYVGGFRYDTPAFAAALRKATDLNMIVQIHNDDPADMARLCAENPATTFVLAHLGDSPAECATRIALAARFPNLSLDISGHGFQRMGILELAVRAAGAERILFGSDYTINDPAGGIARIQMADFPADTKEMLLGGALLRLLSAHGWTPI